MYREPESRRRQLGGVLFFLVSLALLLYLAFAALHSEYGLIRLVQIEEREARLQQELSGLRAERAAIASKTAQLSGRPPGPRPARRAGAAGARAGPAGRAVGPLTGPAIPPFAREITPVESRPTE